METRMQLKASYLAAIRMTARTFRYLVYICPGIRCLASLACVFRRILCQEFLAETVETRTKNRSVIEATHVLQRKVTKD